jgi:hypothetical protein
VEAVLIHKHRARLSPRVIPGPSRFVALFLRDKHRADEPHTNHCASKMPNESAQFSPCSLLIAFPWEGQEIDFKMQSNSS